MQDGDRSYPLETVKVLKELMDADSFLNPRLAETSASSLCADPALPQAFLPVCHGQGAAMTFYRLGESEPRDRNSTHNTGCTH